MFPKWIIESRSDKLNLKAWSQFHWFALAQDISGDFLNFMKRRLNHGGRLIVVLEQKNGVPSAATVASEKCLQKCRY